MESQSEAANRERLGEAFAELTRNTPFTADRINRIRDDDTRRTEREIVCLKKRFYKKDNDIVTQAMSFQ